MVRPVEMGPVDRAGPASSNPCRSPSAAFRSRSFGRNSIGVGVEGVLLGPAPREGLELAASFASPSKTKHSTTGFASRTPGVHQPEGRLVGARLVVLRLPRHPEGEAEVGAARGRTARRHATGRSLIPGTVRRTIRKPVPPALEGPDGGASAMSTRAKVVSTTPMLLHARASRRWPAALEDPFDDLARGELVVGQRLEPHHLGRHPPPGALGLDLPLVPDAGRSPGR